MTEILDFETRKYKEGAFDNTGLASDPETFKWSLDHPDG
jgi:hypothetical protein